ncbi:NADH-dependent alcohol dehydrogenase [Bacteroidia bacterium]|nr:NADH-dependent alcohol dehydrogenase [Bacteroidia bacterium]GHV45220.1 NADH-dependent alcohol dehydrogenase [Bacteroidia bacterium]
MKNFTLHNPTKLIFGKNTISHLSSELDKNDKIMLVFGGGSVKKNAVYQQVVNALKGYTYVEFWGVEPNPTVETLRKAVELAKKEKVTFLLAVGGGSVIDGTKLLTAAIPSEEDAWDILIGKKAIEKMLPFGTVLTISATGSEMNSGAVISNKATKEKFANGFDYPKFSILDPTVLYSLPAYQVANGLADTFVHVTEQYLNVSDESPLMDRWAEGILQTLLEISPKLLKLHELPAEEKNENNEYYDLMSNYMLCATMALNDFISLGITEDWATHQIGHELTALEGVTHGESLAIVLPSLLTVMKGQKFTKLFQYGKRVFNLSENTFETKESVVDAAIAETKTYFRSIGLATSLHEKNIDESTVNEIVKRFQERNSKMGEAHNIDFQVVEKILRIAL